MEPSAVAGPSAAPAGQAAGHHATAGSPFYQRFHQGLENAPLAELPVLTKATLLQHFDQLTTDPALGLDALEAYLAGLAADERFAGRYWVASTSGSSGRKASSQATPTSGHDPGSYARANQWAGINAGLRHRVRMAVVSPRRPGISPRGWRPPCAAR